MKIAIVHKAEEVAPFVEFVRKKADSDRNALGFLPQGAYQDAADQGKLIIAFSESVNFETYAGHLLFGGVYPKGTIFQLFVDPAYRRTGIGHRLIRTIVARCQASQYLSITAQVATDLTEANFFWERHKFRVVRTRAGGASRGRSINIRVRDLKTPNLLDVIEPSTGALTTDFRISDRLTTKSPLYVIDLNVLYDVVKKRLRSHEASSIMSAGFKGLIRIAVTEEFIEELQRTSTSLSNDPVLELALQLPRMPHPPDQALRTVVRELATLVFPHRAAKGTLSRNDESDLKHLATAVHHKANGFVTSEKALLRARDNLRVAHGLDVVGVVDFAGTLAPMDTQNQPVLSSVSEGFQVRVTELNSDGCQVATDFLRQMFVPPDVLAEVLKPSNLDEHRRRLIVVSNDDIVAYASWQISMGPQHVAQSFICADEDHSAAESVLDYLLDRMCREASQSVPALIQFRELPGHSSTRRIALAHGFRADHNHSHSGSPLQKLSIGYPIDEANWQAMRHLLQQIAGFKLPNAIPTYSGHQQLIPLGIANGDTIEISLRDLENILSPVLFMLPGRNSAIVPIRRTYADDLFGLSPQLSLLSSPEAVLLSQRAYFSDPRTAGVLTEGTPLLFYESGEHHGRKSIIAAARVVETSLVLKEDIDSNLRRRGVLSPKEMRQIGSRMNVLATRFDNILVLRDPVGISRLRDIGCVDRRNLVTAQQVGNEHAATILQEGRAHG